MNGANENNIHYHIEGQFPWKKYGIVYLCDSRGPPYADNPSEN